MEQAYHDAGFDTIFTQAFACEVDGLKRKWIHGVIYHGKGQEDSICIFRDIVQLGQATALCWTHSRNCKVPSVDILVVGTSCKDMSKLNPQHAQNRAILAMPSSGGGSAQTFHGLLSYTSAHRPCLLLFENVDAMDDGGGDDGRGSNMDVMLSEMASRGYEGQQFLVDSTEFGVSREEEEDLHWLCACRRKPCTHFPRQARGKFVSDVQATCRPCTASATMCLAALDA